MLEIAKRRSASRVLCPRNVCERFSETVRPTRLEEIGCSRVCRNKRNATRSRRQCRFEWTEFYERTR